MSMNNLHSPYYSTFGSNVGTPNTVDTAYTPAQSLKKQLPSNCSSSTANVGNDPFVQSTSVRSRMSATAEAFRPGNPIATKSQYPPVFDHLSHLAKHCPEISNLSTLKSEAADAKMLESYLQTPTRITPGNSNSIFTPQTNFTSPPNTMVPSAYAPNLMMGIPNFYSGPMVFQSYNDAAYTYPPMAYYNPYFAGGIPASPGHIMDPATPPGQINPYNPSFGFQSPQYYNGYGSAGRKKWNRLENRHKSSEDQSHNIVDVNRIIAGLDVRTTIMLRNIPNKVNLIQLRKIVNDISFGRYDFMYLRIDFSNNCNVGYAFINFVDPLDIVPFVEARAGQKWGMFSSHKVAEVSYATIQGRDCLIQKFRNSSVMLEPEHCRPKLYHTLNDLLGRAGEEDPFPESDNASKLKRSCENAEHVGLFAPTAGAQLRREQRGRQSEYDRGTTMATAQELGIATNVATSSELQAAWARYEQDRMGDFSPY